MMKLKALFTLLLLWIITVGVCAEESANLLPNVIAADTKTKLFSEALQLTGLSETLNEYIYAYYQVPEEKKVGIPVWYNLYRYKKYTVFIETDDVLAAQGINDINQLKAYAKKVYKTVQ